MTRLMLVSVALLVSAAGEAQPDEATYVSKSEIEAVVSAPEGGADRQIKVVDIGDLNVAVGVLHRDRVERTDGPIRGIGHTQVTEVYYVISGGGTLITSSTFANARPLDPEAEVVRVAVGPSVAAQFEGGEQREVSAGDVVVIPAGVLHGWVEVEDHVTYLSVRPDPDRVLPAGYINPVLNR